MANELAVLPDECPNHGSTPTWVDFTQFGFYYCTHAVGTPERCMWPVNMWTPESNSYQGVEDGWVLKWKQAWGYA